MASPLTLSFAVAGNADGSQTRFSATPVKVCNGTLFVTGGTATLLTAGGSALATIYVGSGLDVSGTDLSALYFSGASATLGFFGSVYQGA